MNNIYTLLSISSFIHNPSSLTTAKYSFVFENLFFISKYLLFKLDENE